MKRKTIYLLLIIISGVFVFIAIWSGKSKEQPDDNRNSATLAAVSNESITMQP